MANSGKYINLSGLDGFYQELQQKQFKTVSKSLNDLNSRIESIEDSVPEQFELKADKAEVQTYMQDYSSNSASLFSGTSRSAVSAYSLTNTAIKVSSAGTADKLGTATVGSITEPIYLNSGNPTTCIGDVGWMRRYTNYKEIYFTSSDTYENFIADCTNTASFAYKLFGSSFDDRTHTLNSIGRLNLSGASAISTNLGVGTSYPMFHIVAVRQAGYVDFTEGKGNTIRYRFNRYGELTNKTKIILSGDTNAPITAASAIASQKATNDSLNRSITDTYIPNISSNLGQTISESLTNLDTRIGDLETWVGPAIESVNYIGTVQNNYNLLYANSAHWNSGYIGGNDWLICKANTAFVLSGKCYSAYSAGTALNLSSYKASAVINSAKSGQSAYDWIVNNSGVYQKITELTGVENLDTITGTGTYLIKSQNNGLATNSPENGFIILLVYNINDSTNTYREQIVYGNNAYRRVYRSYTAQGIPSGYTLWQNVAANVDTGKIEAKIIDLNDYYNYSAKYTSNGINLHCYYQNYSAYDSNITVNDVYFPYASAYFGKNITTPSAHINDYLELNGDMRINGGLFVSGSVNLLNHSVLSAISSNIVMTGYHNLSGDLNVTGNISITNGRLSGDVDKVDGYHISVGSLPNTLTNDTIYFV